MSFQASNCATHGASVAAAMMLLEVGDTMMIGLGRPPSCAAACRVFIDAAYSQPLL
jgi:hypothetical protein